MTDQARAEGRLGPLNARPLLETAAAVLLCLLAFAASPPAAWAADGSAMVIDANTGKVLYDDAGDAARYPASLTKMMTLYLTFELIEKERLKFDDKITISAQAAAQPPSKLDLDAGDTISVRNAVLSLVTKSANDIAVALAEHIAGSEANFARLMTRKAREIGMSKTTFRNASGLPDGEQVTTARDMLTLALRLQDEFPEHYKLFATGQFRYAGHNYRNHNTLLRSYRGTDGIKTGYTRASGFNLVTSVHRSGKHLVAAVFGGQSAGSRNARMRAILDRSFIKAASRRTRPRLDRPQLIAKPRPAERRTAAASVLAPKEPPPLPSAAPAAPAAQSKAQAVAPAAASAPEPAPHDDRIKIARVRHVGVAQHLAERRTLARDAAALAKQDNSPPDSAPRSIAELIASHASAPTGPRASLGMQVNGAIVPAPSAATPVGLTGEASARAEAEPSNPQPPRGRAPSSLQEQLSTILASNRPAMMDEPAPQHTPPASKPAAAPAAVADLRGTHVEGTHLIQIGAYNSADEAERHLATVRDKATTVLAGAAGVTEPITRGQRRYYRARFAGFDSAKATSTCQELRRRAIDCFVTRTP